MTSIEFAMNAASVPSSKGSQPSATSSQPLSTSASGTESLRQKKKAAVPHTTSAMSIGQTISQSIRG
jgi:hypothetical protein